ncbi:MAG: UDP-N-acetylmuramoyl-L-alanine--D-glutamate ligase [Planctomycetaceae bacterium]|nr:UDP-N-acetylmuramoyl-L-alanine--D-glutamate ligase [Planctomycetaceae bacterium]
MKWNLPLKPDMHITAMGLGLFGGQLAAIRHCAELGAQVLVTDQSTPELLAESVASLQHYPNVSFRFGLHQLKDFAFADLIVVSPAVPASHACLQAAVQRGVPIVTEIELFLANCDSPIIAVSGTVGKSTTATMIQHLLDQLGIVVHLGGNIGKSLLPEVEEITQHDWAILELSSFQLHWLSRNQCSFDVAVLTNYFPHHLDWHREEKSYRECKQNLFRDQTSEQLAVLPIGLKQDTNWGAQGERIYFGPDDSIDSLERWPAHIGINAQAAIAVADWICRKKHIEITRKELALLLADFQGLPHRMQHLAEKKGRLFFNDSKATSPQATIAAVNSLTQPTWLIIGGALVTDDFEELISKLCDCSLLQGIACVGVTGQRVDDAISQQNNSMNRSRFSDLQPAVNWCWENSQPGETILLSPACPSYDEFLNYEQRGDTFAHYVNELV